MGTTRTRRARRYTEHEDYLAMVARVIRQAGRRIGTTDDEHLRGLLALHEVVDEAIADAVVTLNRDAGFPWRAIAEVTGTTRQAAWERWGKSAKTSTTRKG